MDAHIGAIMMLLGALNLTGTLAITAASLAVAIYCTKKKLRPVAAWLLLAGWVISLLTDFGWLANTLALKIGGYMVYEIFNLFLQVIGLSAIIVVAIALIMLRPMPQGSAAAAGEASHE